MPPVVSLIVTVFNKASYLPDTVKSLFRQQAGLPMEYIFVDDLSSDNSVAVIEELAVGMENVRIIRNTRNAGPAIRLNQGAALAQGEFLQFFDSDDIMPLGTTALLHRLLVENQAQLVYGRWTKTGIASQALLSQAVNGHAAIHISDMPLITILQDSFSRMTCMVYADVFARAGGADERIFIQDESLPLRLAAAAERMITLETPVLLVPKQGETLSSNTSQLNHDRFLANYFMLRDRQDISARARSLLFKRCVSAAWKHVRQDRRGLAGISWIFWYYLFIWLHPKPPVRWKVVEKLERIMHQIRGVRRVAN